MQTVRQIQALLARSRRVPALVIALVLVILAGVVVLTTWQTRQSIREQIVARDGEVLYAVAQMHHAEDVTQGSIGMDDSRELQLNVVLKSAELRGVLGVRLFDADGHLVESFPPYVLESLLDTNALPALKALKPVSRFQSRVEMWELFYPDEGIEETEPIPLLEVLVPLHSEGGPLAGIAQYLVAGQGIADAYARLDRQLAAQALMAFGVGGVILTSGLLWAFFKLNRSQKLLAERTGNLARANQELVLAAKTSALGAVTAHLIHGLKNPLAGLENFVTARGPGGEALEEADWQQAVASTRRMQAMINQVVGVLREDQSDTAYDVTLAELEGMVRNRIQPLARERSVNFTTLIHTDSVLPNRAANLVALILVNLCENAIQATPAGRKVTLTASRQAGRLSFEVADEGSGFPADTPLFMPCRSTKEGGTGIGLALCKQLALHLGAELELMTSTPAGSVFALRLAEAGRAKDAVEARLPKPELT